MPETSIHEHSKSLSKKYNVDADPKRTYLDREGFPETEPAPVHLRSQSYFWASVDSAVGLHRSSNSFGRGWRRSHGNEVTRGSPRGAARGGGPRQPIAYSGETEAPR